MFPDRESVPGEPTVTEKFELGWDSVLAMSEQIIVARLDGRGPGFRGQRLLEQVYHRLRTVDVEDQIAALEFMVRQPYVDRTRVGVYGQVRLSD
ncbi:hypothetical protein ATANTOWER_027189 [Ataeniobius toweri]|uniref:Peptidase S9 prolyl oligopeptidase catalytic domain-containing protein n=1 Tax=Ataeniobius toweri TaxID=208326 RepID=A0ABU7CJL5_9TELE|nr:hypothetical protein [Ataeniobius toweri]